MTVTIWDAGAGLEFDATQKVRLSWLSVIVSLWALAVPTTLTVNVSREAINVMDLTEVFTLSLPPEMFIV